MCGVLEDFGEPVVFRKNAKPTRVIYEDGVVGRLDRDGSRRSPSVSPEPGLCRKVRSARREAVRCGSSS